MCVIFAVSVTYTEVSTLSSQILISEVCQSTYFTLAQLERLVKNCSLCDGSKNLVHCHDLKNITRP